MRRKRPLPNLKSLKLHLKHETRFQTKRERKIKVTSTLRTPNCSLFNRHILKKDLNPGTLEPAINIANLNKTHYISSHQLTRIWERSNCQIVDVLGAKSND